MNDPAAKSSSDEQLPPDRNWRTAMSRTLQHREELLLALGLMPGHDVVARAFPLRVPRGFVDRMQPGDPDDPLLRQVLTTREESLEVDGYSSDPVGDLDSAIAPGVLKKYAGRALLIVTGACAIHCRYCFRRTYPYAHGSLTNRELANAIDLLAADPTIEEIILSGGDPLTLPNSRLDTLVDKLTQIPHVRRIRIHTRIPVVMPERIDSYLLDIVATSRRPVIFVIHCNHAREINASAASAVGALIDAGATVLNQSVLLRGVNDSADALTDLSECLFDIGVLPYYLHQLDPVIGTAHFAVEDAQAIELVDAISGRLPGYLVPRLVKEIPGRSAKTPLHGTPSKHNNDAA